MHLFVKLIVKGFWSYPCLFNMMGNAHVVHMGGNPRRNFIQLGGDTHGRNNRVPPPPHVNRIPAWISAHGCTG